jgi:hypothetical protein
MTPVIVYWRSSSVMVLPMISRPPPRRRHREVEMTALVASTNHWPRRGEPSCRTSAGVTAAPDTNCGSPAVNRYRPALNQPNASKLVVCCS